MDAAPRTRQPKHSKRHIRTHAASQCEDVCQGKDDKVTIKGRTQQYKKGALPNKTAAGMLHQHHKQNFAAKAMLESFTDEFGSYAHTKTMLAKTKATSHTT